MSEKNIETKKQDVDIDINEILGTPSGETIVNPEPKEEEKQNKGFFDDLNIDTSFLDKFDEITSSETKKETSEEETKKEPEEESTKAEDIQKEKENDSIDDVLNENDEEEEKPSKKDAPKYNAVKKLIENGVIKPFQDMEDIDQYSEDDIEQLLQMNMESAKDAVRQETVVEWYNSLPTELQQVFGYYIDGGTDLKQALRSVRDVQELKDLTTDNEANQKTIIREYLKAKAWGSDAEIEDEIDDLEDRGDLKKKAEKYKPLLDKMNEQILMKKFAEQESNRKRKEEVTNNYKKSIINALSKPINGIQLSDKDQEMIFRGLTEPVFDSMNGGKINRFGALLEHYQYGKEQNVQLIAEAYWLLSDPEGYKQKVRENVKKEVVEQTVRKLKTEQQGGKSQTANSTEEDKPQNKVPKRNLTRGDNRSFFSF